MVAIRIGDIVEVRQFPGQRWSVIGPHEHGIPPGRLWKVRRESAGRPSEGRVCGDGDLEVLDHPIFTAGQVVTFAGREAKVVRDDGATIRLKYLQLRPRNLDRHDGIGRVATVQICESDVERGDLVAENL